MKETRYKGKYMEVTEEVIDHHTYERIHLNSGVRVYPIKNAKVLMINEIRKHEGISRWKFIGGWMDKEGKSELETAKEELAEEAGMEARLWEEFHVFDTGSSTISMKSTHFIAFNPTLLKTPILNPDGDIISEIKWVSLDELWNMIDEKKLLWDYDAFSAVQALRLRGKN